MRTRKVVVILAAVAMLGLNGLAGAAITTMRDSADFAYKAECTVYPENENPAWLKYLSTNPTPPTCSLADGILSYVSINNENANVSWYNHPTWMSDVDEDTGWTVEAKVRIDTVYTYANPSPPPDTLPYAPFGLTAGDGEAQGDGGRGILFVYGSKVEWKQLTTVTSLDTNDNTDGFHIFRIAKDAAANTYSIWRDGELLSSSMVGYWGNSLYLAFGDIGGDFRGDASIDYVRFDLTGPYAPIPEPVTMALLALGGLATLIRRRHR